MPIYEKFSFSPKTNVLSGFLGGKMLNCTIRPGGTVPPPGNYHVLPPVNDPVYGLVALIVADEGPEERNAAYDWIKAPGRGMGGASVFTYSMPPMNRGLGVSNPLPARASDGWTTRALDFCTPGSGGVFVLTDKSMPGQNCLVLNSGFSDLIEGLQAAGGAQLFIWF